MIAQSLGPQLEKMENKHLPTQTYRCKTINHSTSLILFNAYVGTKSSRSLRKTGNIQERGQKGNRTKKEAENKF